MSSRLGVVIDAVRPGGHPRDQARHLQARVDAALAARPDALRDQVVRPARCASAITGTRLTCDTRFGSSNDACVFARLCNNRT